MAEVCRLKTQPNRRISRFLRPIPRNLRDEMASWTSFWPPGAQKPLKSEELSAEIKVSHIAYHVSEFQPSNHRTGVLQPLFRLVKTEVLRSGTSKSLGLAEVYRLKTQPNRRITRFPRPIPRNLRDEMASWTSFWPPGAQKTLKSDELSAKIKVSAFFARAFKSRDPKSSKKSSPGGQHEPQERLRRSQERPKAP